MPKYHGPVQEPNTTQVPNALFDEWLPEVRSLSEMKVTLAIVRQTMGTFTDHKKLTMDDLQRLTGLSRQSVSDGVAAMIEGDLIKRERQGRSGFVYYLRVSRLLPVQKVDRLNACPPKSTAALHHEVIEGTKKETTTAAAVKETDRQTEQQLFDLWVQLTGRNGQTQFTDTRRRHLRARLRDSSAAELEQAIRNCAASAWHQEHGQQKFEQIFRSRERVEFWLERAPGSAAAEDFSAYDEAIER